MVPGTVKNTSLLNLEPVVMLIFDPVSFQFSPSALTETAQVEAVEDVQPQNILISPEMSSLTGILMVRSVASSVPHPVNLALSW